MSYITNVLIHGARQEHIDDLNAWLLRHDPERKQQFQPINMDAAGGTKWYTDKVWAAAFNYSPEGLEEKLRDAATWKNGVLSIAVIIAGEETDCAFVFDNDGTPDGEYVPVMEQEFRS